MTKTRSPEASLLSRLKKLLQDLEAEKAEIDTSITRVIEAIRLVEEQTKLVDLLPKKGKNPLVSKAFELLREMTQVAPKSPKRAIPKETPASQTETSTPPPPSDQGKAKTAKKPKKYGTLPLPAKLLKEALKAEPLPDTLEKALALTYGESWPAIQVSTVRNKGKVDVRTLMEDLSTPDSIVRWQLALTMKNLLRLSEETQSGGEIHASIRLLNLQKAIQGHTPDKISALLNSWGVNL